MEEPLQRLIVALVALMRWFDEHELQAAVIGGVGASLRGKPRLTKDIDAVVVDADAEALVKSGAEFGFTPRIADAIEFARNKCYSKRGNGPDRTLVDVFSDPPQSSPQSRR